LRLVERSRARNDVCIEPPISFSDVTTIMRLLSDIHEQVRRIRSLLEEGNGEEEEDSENDA